MYVKLDVYVYVYVYVFPSILIELTIIFKIFKRALFLSSSL